MLVTLNMPTRSYMDSNAEMPGRPLSTIHVDVMLTLDSSVRWKQLTLVSFGIGMSTELDCCLDATATDSNIDAATR